MSNAETLAQPAAHSRQTRGVNHAALLRLVTGYLDCLPRCWYAKIAGGAYQRPGLPDLIAAITPVAAAQRPGDDVAAFVAIEVKTGSSLLNAAQRRERGRIERAGGLYIVARSIDDVQAAFVAAGLARPILT